MEPLILLVQVFFFIIRITRQIQTHADHMSNQLKVSACAVVATFY